MTKKAKCAEPKRYEVQTVRKNLSHGDLTTLKYQLAPTSHAHYFFCMLLVIMKHPDDPNKTKFALVAHANPGGDIPHWACKTAVNAIAPIEPFKLFHKINENVKRALPQLERTELVGLPGRSGKPGGLSQMGYACFWPNGGGLNEGYIHPSNTEINDLTNVENEHIDEVVDGEEA